MDGQSGKKWVASASMIRDIPEVPLSIDRYEKRLYVCYYAKNAVNDSSWLPMMVETISDACNVPTCHIYTKTRQRQRGANQYQKLQDKGETFCVTEGGLRFFVNLADYLDTGLFLDHRQTRSLVRKAAGGKDVLNLFCYTGSFSIYAADGGARSVTSIDLSQTYIKWAQRNAGLNDQQRVHKFSAEDVFLFLKRERKDKYDLVVLDPPTFSNSKRMGRDLDLQRDHPQLIASVVRLLRPGESSFFRPNARKFKLSPMLQPHTVVQDISPPHARLIFAGPMFIAVGDSSRRQENLKISPFCADTNVVEFAVKATTKVVNRMIGAEDVACSKNPWIQVAIDTSLNWPAALITRGAVVDSAAILRGTIDQ